MELLTAYNRSTNIFAPAPEEIGSTQLKRFGARVLRENLDHSVSRHREAGLNALKILLDFSYWRRSASLFNDTQPQQIASLKELDELTDTVSVLHGLLSLIKYDGVFNYALPTSFRIILCSLSKVDLDKLNGRLNAAQNQFLISNNVGPHQPGVFTLMPGAILMMVLKFLNPGATVMMSLTNRQCHQQVLRRHAICLCNPVLRDISHRIGASRRLSLLAKNGFFDHLTELPTEIEGVLLMSDADDSDKRILEQGATVENMTRKIQLYKTMNLEPAQKLRQYYLRERTS